MKHIRIGVFDDNEKVLHALRLIIEGTEGFEWAGGFPDVSNIINDYINSRPDVVLMDIQMPGMTGTEAVKLLRKSFPELKVLMLTNFDDDKIVFEAICNGASGYLLKNTPPVKLLESLREAYEGGAPMTPSIARNVLIMLKNRNMPDNADAKQEYQLTPREIQVLEVLVSGKSLKMVGDHLHISYDTVRTHIKHIYEKLHVFSLTEAVAKALREKLVN